MESKWKVEPSELRMEFYLDILQAFAKSEENVVGIYMEAKFMLVAKVRLILLNLQSRISSSRGYPLHILAFIYHFHLLKS